VGRLGDILGRPELVGAVLVGTVLVSRHLDRPLLVERGLGNRVLELTYDTTSRRIVSAQRRDPPCCVVSAVRPCQIAAVIARRSWTTRAPTSRERRAPKDATVRAWAEGEIENGGHDMRDRTRRPAEDQITTLIFYPSRPRRRLGAR
jgi:hypothetical protein